MRVKSSTVAVLSVLLGAVLLVTAGLWLGRDTETSGRTVVRLRIWDQSFVPAYRAALDEFQRDNPDVEVRITVVPWASYQQKLRLDVAGGTADDLFWTNMYTDYADAGKLSDIGAMLGPDAVRQWDPDAVSQYTRNGKLWAVPQFVDGGTAVYYNRDLLAAAGIDPAQLGELTWNPHGPDTFRPLLRRLAAAAPWVYNAANDFQSIELPYLGSAGGRFQDGDRYVFDSPQAVDAFGYLTDLIGAGLTPPAADIRSGSDFAKNAFLQGKLALFQSGSFALSSVVEQAGFRWGIAMIPAGPAGRVSTNNAIGIAAGVHSAHPGAVRRVLSWLGSAAGNRYLAAGGQTIPAAIADQQLYRDYWSHRGIDVSPFFDVLRGRRIESGGGPGFTAALQAVDAIFDEMFLGRIPVPEALHRAEIAARDAAA